MSVAIAPTLVFKRRAQCMASDEKAFVISSGVCGVEAAAQLSPSRDLVGQPVPVEVPVSG